MPSTVDWAVSQLPVAKATQPYKAKASQPTPKLSRWGAGHKQLACLQPELVRRFVKPGWWSHRSDPTDWATQWPYYLPHYPLPHQLSIEEMGICRRAQEAKHKPCDQL